MFERKNQSILSEHYTKLVDHSIDRNQDADSEDDFITLKRADHDLPGDGELPESEFTSKRKVKMAMSKKAIAKSGPKGNKLVFDEDGLAHEIYELKTTNEVFRGADDIKEAGRKFAEGERGKMQEADVVDKAEAKEKKREKKRKRKEREKEEMGHDDGEGMPMTTTLAPVEDGDGYVSPDFDLPSESEDDLDAAPPPPKRAKAQSRKRDVDSDLEEEEQLALQFLRSR
ncbi:uncharacterized protein FIBRA_07708 [Fibroporia radiculosa]|uniref:Uncharacterized protein n=1 Tax=Fibroporia radiculosa TaxID=599839 RepID=J4I168_9APHY|nr:uncharacterized protein FIBRA_07708 [Fibroporia radiculosa]CCM05487.1 predicted protein [Fibroporia radiculosa]